MRPLCQPSAHLARELDECLIPSARPPRYRRRPAGVRRDGAADALAAAARARAGRAARPRRPAPAVVADRLERPCPAAPAARLVPGEHLLAARELAGVL